ncbi:MAG: CDP-glucose 4,6-dehydratase [Pseudomonadota bacterium]|jgi:CDP-glucose 4,6-dehydratase
MSDATSTAALHELFGGVYAGRRVLVTGHTGFKGSWLALWLQQMGAQVQGLALPAEGPDNHAALLALDLDARMVDLRDADAVRAAMQALRPDIVFHLAAQALVRPSYADPAQTYATNVQGLVHLYEAVRATSSVRAVLVATTDKVYANQHTRRGYHEDDRLGGHDPYSASKACAELVSASYRASFFGRDDGRGHAVALATARAGNVIGGGDWSVDRLLPDLVRAALSGEVCVLRHPASTRPWQHVLEPLAGYLLLGQRLLEQPADVANAWNFGPDSQGHLSVAEIVGQFAHHWPALRHRVDAASAAGLHEAELLHLDCSRARRDLGWRPVWPAATMLERTAAWYRAYHEGGRLDSLADLQRYVADARQTGAVWCSAPQAVPAPGSASPSTLACAA